MYSRSYTKLAVIIGVAFPVVPLCFVVGIPFFQRPEQPALDVVGEESAPALEASQCDQALPVAVTRPLHPVTLPDAPPQQEVSASALQDT